MKIKYMTTEEFENTQGDGLAPVLFNIALDKVFREVEINTRGIIVYRNQQVVVHVDNVTIFGWTRQLLEEKYKELN